MNSVNLIGRLADNPLIKANEENTWARFPIAIQKNAENANYFTIIAFDSTAEFVEKYFVKGDRIGISGYLNQSVYETKEGETRYSVEVIANRVYFADGKREEIEKEETSSKGTKNESRNNKRSSKKYR